MTKILFAPKQPDPIVEIAKSLTPPGFELVMADPGTPEFYNVAGEAEYFLGFARRMSTEFFRSAPNLKLVQLTSAGYDQVDIEAARKAGVPVSNNGGANAIAVAEHAMALMLAVLKKIVWHHNNVAAGKWRVGNFAEPSDLLRAIDKARADAAELLDVAHEVGREYVEGRAPFQPHVHVRAIVFDFLFTYAHMVQHWAERAATELEAWTQLDVETRRKRGRDRIARAFRDETRSSPKAPRRR